MFEQAMQLRAIPTPAGRGLLEQTPTSRRSECFGLQGVVLFVAFRDAGTRVQDLGTGDALVVECGVRSYDSDPAERSHAWVTAAADRKGARFGAAAAVSGV